MEYGQIVIKDCCIISDEDIRFMVATHNRLSDVQSNLGIAMQLYANDVIVHWSDLLQNINLFQIKACNRQP